MTPIGRTRWAMAEGYIPAYSQGPRTAVTSHETACLLNASDGDAFINMGGIMRTWIAIGVGIIGLGCVQVHGALGAESAKQDKGIVNERSTGNEPFMGSGASGGPTHSSPGATERTVQDSMKNQSEMGGKKGTGSASDQSKKPPFSSQGTGGGR